MKKTQKRAPGRGTSGAALAVTTEEDDTGSVRPRARPRPLVRRALPETHGPATASGARGGRDWAVVEGDAENTLKKFPRGWFDCVVTSPPYYWQRDYETEGQIGQEDTVEAYVARLVGVFHEVKRTLKSRGVAFLVLGDTYYSGKGQPRGVDRKQVWRGVARRKYRAVDRPGFGLPRKTMIGIPWRVALALQADGWRIRSAVTWTKPKPLAEPSVRDRPWSTSEWVFILSRSTDYFFNRAGLEGEEDVWTIQARSPGRAYRHAAPFPEALVERCLACGCAPGGRVLDPFAGSGTTLGVALRRGSPAVGVELNPAYCAMAARRITRGGAR